MMGGDYWCHTCNKAYTHKEDHRGGMSLLLHLRDGLPCQLVEWTKCDDCRHWFKSRACFDRYKVAGVEKEKNGKW